MFENFNVTSRAATDHIEINLQWHWTLTDGMVSLPYCKVFCCTIPESLLLRDSIFSQNEILAWINREVLDLSNPDTRISNIESYYNNPSNKSHCKLNKYQLMSGGGIHSTQQLIFGIEDLNKVFLVCVYGERTFEIKIFAVKTLDTIKPTITKPGFFDKMKGNNSNKLSFEDSGDRRRVLVTNYNGEMLYSILPGGNEFFVDKDFGEENIVEVVYLSSLIGN